MKPYILGLFFLNQKSIYNKIVHLKEFITYILKDNQVEQSY